MKIMVEMSEEEISRTWLARSGMVAVDRALMNDLAALNNRPKTLSEFEIVYNPARDYYGPRA